MPPRKTTFNGVTVDLGKFPEAYSRYVELSGNELKHPIWGIGAKDLLNEVVQGNHQLSQVYELYSDGPDGGKADFIRDILNEYRSEARIQLLTEFGALQAEYDMQRQKPKTGKLQMLNR